MWRRRDKKNNNFKYLLLKFASIKWLYIYNIITEKNYCNPVLKHIFIPNETRHIDTRNGQILRKKTFWLHLLTVDGSSEWIIQNLFVFILIINLGIKSSGNDENFQPWKFIAKWLESSVKIAVGNECQHSINLKQPC